ncbi:MAG TPA: ABC transporter permease [Chthonomonadales bacterium]|nr:ABC transporter permease [Chthonomonadales bacterium]
MHSGNWLSALLMAALFSAIPLLLAAMGGILSERAGVINIGLEGLMLSGAFVGVWAGQRSALIGLLAAIAAGGLLGLTHAYLTQRLRMDHVVSGLAINLFAAGATRSMALLLFRNGIRIPGLPPSLFLALAIALPPGVLFLLFRTRFGLRLRSVGESPESAILSGVSSGPPRYAAVALSGVLAALGGAYLSMADSHTFSSNMSAGRGYIALAAVIFGKWTPHGAAAGALLFGLFYALQTQFQISGVRLSLLGVHLTSPYLLDSLPYLVTLLALITVVGRAAPPAALGRQI